MKLLEIKDLKVYFPIKDKLFGKPEKFIKAVNGVSFHVKKGETFGIVGESGSGKSTIAMTILGIHRKTGGEIVFKGKTIESKEDFKFLRKKVQIVLQDPEASLDPRKKIKYIVREGLDIYKIATKDERNKRVKEVILKVGLTEEVLNKYPHELSGGQKQRVSIARALVLEPELLILDEPTSSLDVSVQAQILNLLMDLQERLALTYIFISHDLKVVEHIADRVMIMYLGKIMEMGSAQDILLEPLHPYTKALLSSVPLPDPKRRKDEEVFEGEVPSPLDPPRGCPFKTRCKYAMDICDEPPKPVRMNDRLIFCHLYKEG
ncbi:MAG: dipeptide ABC transporter ATP-binding protein [Thermotogae bacterium]|nr:MAG: dipeptide ABC transporter ATP-binding protein [Thermotogota bacterium]